MHMQATSDHHAGQPPVDTPGWQLAVGAGILGWVLDAFDFFVIVFLFNELMAKFHVDKASIVWSLTLTLAMRPIGAFVFGALADRYGRKKPLIACVLYFSLVTVLSGFAPNYVVFMAMRALYGIGMGGYWGIGASFAMESAPTRMRGVLSGLMQGGYPAGYLAAAIGMQTIAPRFGWQAMFLIGSVVAVLIVLITLKAPESDAWRARTTPSFRSMLRIMIEHRNIFAFMLLMMTMMPCLSHGTQDLYPDFLKSIPWVASATVFGMKSAYGIPVVYNLAAIAGALFFGTLSEKIGRRKAVILAFALCLIAMPAWAFGTTLLAIVLGSCLMQTGVQGAFGVIPAHLNELSPGAIRGLFPGFVYQLGVLLSAPAAPFESLLQRHFGYSWALASFELAVLASLVLIFWFGPEHRGRDFKATDSD
jgi:SHS family lactate transporter-like MFS transporter